MVHTNTKHDDIAMSSVPAPQPDQPSVPDLPRPSGIYADVLKRVIDIVGSAALLLVFSPVLAAVGLAIRLKMGRGIFYKQQRIGRDGRAFDMVKFRSMNADRRHEDHEDEEVYEGPDRRLTHKTTDDPRHTGLGRFVRKWSLDELPQLWNVLRGHMSLIGPRPELKSVAERRNFVDHPRHLVRPGITGLWQISPDRHNLLHENLSYDLDYVEHFGFRQDVRIALRTAGAVLRGRGS